MLPDKNIPRDTEASLKDEALLGKTLSHKGASASQSLGKILEQGFERAVFDLDQTLVFSSLAHKALIIAAVNSCCNDDLSSEVNRAYEPMRGQPYRRIVHTVHEACGGINVLNCTPTEFEKKIRQTAKGVSDGSITITEKPSIIRGADALLSRISREGLSPAICTGSWRELAEMMIKLADLNTALGNVPLFCSGDLPFDKSNPKYWSHVLCDTPRDKVIGFEDHPHGTEWMLRAGEFGKVLVFPSVDVQRFDNLKNEFGERLFIISEGWDGILD